MRVVVEVKLKPSVLDPQGEAVARALKSLGFDGVGSVRQGKVFEIEVDEKDPEAARRAGEAMGEKLLANAVIETYEVSVG